MGNQLTHAFTSSRRHIARRPVAAARDAPASSAALLSALLADCDAAATRLSASIPALASLAADLVARNDESKTAAPHKAASYRSALLVRKTRVMGCANRLSRKQGKMIVADFEAADVSTEQLRVWSAVARADCLDNFVCGLDCAFATSPLLSVPRQVQAPVIDMCASTIFLLAGDLGSVVTGDGLRVVSAAGPGLKWFEPRSRNEFRVMLVQADGRVPVWLTTDDVAVAVLGPSGAAATGSGGSPAAMRVESEGHGTLAVVYGGLSEEAPEVLLELTVTVCGVPVACALGDGAWSVCVPRKLLADHECAAVGAHVRTLPVGWGFRCGMAVCADEKWLVLTMRDCTLCVYSLPGGELVRSFGARGDGPMQFKGLGRMCFAPNGNLIVVEEDNERLQEVMLEGVFVRFIGVGEFARGTGRPSCVAIRDDVIAVGCASLNGPRVALLDFETGSVMSRFGEVGSAPGQLCRNCTGIRFTPDGSRLIIAEGLTQCRVSVFTTAGALLQCVGVSVLGEGDLDVVLSVTGEFVVADKANHRVCVFVPDGSELVRSWGTRGTGVGHPTILAAAGVHWYVMEYFGGNVFVFE